MITEGNSQIRFLIVGFVAFVLIGLVLACFLPTGPKFTRRNLMNKSETRLYRIMSAALPPGWAVMAQVSYGAFLANKSFKRYMTINSKRADFVVLNPSNQVFAVVEYQGSGHYGRSKKSKDRAHKSDAIKRRALADAGITLLEVPPRIVKSDVETFVSRLAVAGGFG